jgi:hypothetical protein
MRKFIGLLVFFPCFAGADPAAGYQPLAFLAGHCWTGVFPGGKQTDTHCFNWIYGGKFLRDQHTVRAAGKPDALGESIYFWNSSAKQLEYLYIESDGGFSRGVVSTDTDSLVFPDTTFVENGETQVYRSRWRHIAQNAYDVVTEIQAKNTWVPGFAIRMERADTL